MDGDRGRHGLVGTRDVSAAHGSVTPSAERRVPRRGMHKALVTPW